MAKLSFFTLIFTLTIAHLSLVTIPGVNALEAAGNLRPIARRAEHVDMSKRMIKKRQDTEVPANPAPQPTNTGTSTTQQSGSQSPSSTPATTPETPNTTSNTSQTSTTSTTSATSTTSTTSSTSSTPTTTSAPVTSDAPRTSNSSTRTSSRSTGTVFITQSATPTQTEDVSKDQNASFLSKSVIIGLIVTGSCIVAGAAIWTIIRKWKFSPSRHFEDRLEPVNWEPTQSSGLPHDPTVAALARGNSRTGTRNSTDSSVTGRNNMTTANNDQISMAPDFPPPHDFTAGPQAGQPGYLGAPGYVDMHRGPSPGPAASAYGGQYDTPNPYDAYDYNAGYGQRRY